MAVLRGLLLSLISIVPSAAGLSPAGWRGQSIYQVLTDRFARPDGSTTASCDLNDYCGGTWRGLINKLDYIQDMGFTAVWISPIVKNPIGLTRDGNSYHGYWAQDVYALNPKFGTAADLKALSTALHRRGMYLMLDVVVNHMGSYSARNNVTYSLLQPFNNKKYYHTPCSIDYNNDTSIKDCWIGSNTVSLPDLRTEDHDVQTMWNKWISWEVREYSIDGLRIDTAYQVNQGFWPSFQVAAGGIHTLGEVWIDTVSTLCPYQNYLHGMLNYIGFYGITQAFQSTSGNMTNLVNSVQSVKGSCKDVTLLGSFIENHDNPRFPSLTQDLALIHNAIAFQLLADGIPIIYQGQEHKFNGSGVPQNRQPLWTSGYDRNSVLYQHIKKVNRIRRRAITKNSNYLTSIAVPIYVDAQNIVMRKGRVGNQIVSAYTNRGSNGTQATITISGGKSGFLPYQRITEVLKCTDAKTDSRGNIGVRFVTGKPAVLYPTDALRGSGICGH